VNIGDYLIMGFIFGGIGTSIGGLISVLIYKPSDKLVSGILSFAAGIMLSVTSFDLMPKAYEIGGFFIVTLGLAIGLIMVFFAKDMIPLDKLKQYKGKKCIEKIVQSSFDAIEDYAKMQLDMAVEKYLKHFSDGKSGDFIDFIRNDAE
jgi:zinc transporter ZupT